MKWTVLVRPSLDALLRNRARSVLTVLGLSIGIAAVICVAAISGGAQSRIQHELDNLGDNLVWIEAGGRDVNGVAAGTHSTPTLTLEDAAAIRAQSPLIASVSPHLGGRAQIVSGDRNWLATYHGVGPDYFDIKHWRLDQGSFFQAEDVTRSANVCVIGRTVREQLFGVEEAVGSTIRVAGLPCKVIGVLAPKGIALSGDDQDDTLMLPVTTVQKKLAGVAWINDVVGSAVSSGAITLATEEAAAVLRDRHRLQPGQADDFTIRDLKDVVEAQVQSTRALTILLLCIASVSLLVSGIGVMNVMLISVTERTREIGVRMAVGATEGAILLQFLGEAAVLGLAGGIAGTILGILGSLILGHAVNWPIAVSFVNAVAAGLFATGIALFFGAYPARKAARMNPVHALRFE